MLRKRKIIIYFALALILFILTTNYLHSNLTKSESEVGKSSSKFTSPNTVLAKNDIPSLIYRELENLPDFYKTVQPPVDNVSDIFVANLRQPGLYKNFFENVGNLRELWSLANSWVKKNSTMLDLTSPALGGLYGALKSAKIIRSDLSTKGTQLKFLLTLEGNQTVIFKPKRMENTKIFPPEAPVYGGKDRYGAEIIGFYLSAILNRPRVPFSVERSVSLTHDLIPVASKAFLDTSFLKKVPNNDNYHETGDKNYTGPATRYCTYGKCYYCKKEDAVCEDATSLQLPGAVIFYLNDVELKSYRSPWQRTYKQGKKAPWEVSDDYCKFVRNKLSKQRLLDLIEVSIFDFLIQNGDRHHYETLNDDVVWLDNGKGFRNPYVDHIDILAPLYQCCSLRKNMMKKLESLSGGVLTKKLRQMPDIENFITESHLDAMDRRLLIVYAAVEYCKNRNKYL